MSKNIFNLIIISVGAIFLSVLAHFDLLEKSAAFMLIPLLIFYFLGQYSERHFSK